MSERNQDQRPVFMGTFSKYTRAFESRVAITENEIEDLSKKVRYYSKKADNLKLWMKISAGVAVTLAVGEIAILLLTFLG